LSVFHSRREEGIVEAIGTIVLIIGIWLVLQFIMRKAGLPT
jgi:uncharacterized membrane protein YkgB